MERAVDTRGRVDHVGGVVDRHAMPARSGLEPLHIVQNAVITLDEVAAVLAMLFLKVDA